ncbi:GSCOCG00011510001-RA-CDS [Cotesia congregata]|nr:GSCOCG00011510001-RA-CDS [Cotesia congregata]
MMENFSVECDSTLIDKMNDYRVSNEKLRVLTGNPDGICQLLEPGDAFVVDRGFRDVTEYLESKNYKVLMLYTLKRST